MNLFEQLILIDGMLLHRWMNAIVAAVPPYSSFVGAIEK